MKRLVISFIVSLTCLIGFFLLVSPENKPLPYIFLPVILMWMVLFSLAQIIVRLAFKEQSRLRTVIVFVFVSLIILLLLLSGIGQLTLSDVILASILVAVGTFYFYRTWS